MKKETLSKSKPSPENQAPWMDCRPMEYTNVFMGYLDNNQFQLNRLHNIAYDILAPLGIGNVAYHENNNVHRMNNHEWADKDIRLTY